MLCTKDVSELVKPKNFVSEIITCIFTISSFLIFAKSIISDETSLLCLSLLMYVIPQTIEAGNKFSCEYLTPTVSIINILVMIVGVIVSILSLSLITTSLNIGFVWRCLIIFVSSIFIITPVYNLTHEIHMHYNIHKSIYQSLEV